MPAHSENFPWPSHYGHFQFFEQRLAEHSKVHLYNADEVGFYNVALKSGVKLRVFICECYAFGVSEYLETKARVNDLSIIVINSAWCGYTDEAKLQSRSEEIGLFKIRDFMAAINHRRFWMYLDEYDKERFEKMGWL